jgi:ribose transport system permease protein
MTAFWRSRYSYALPPFAMFAVLLVINASVGSTFLDPTNWNALVIGAAPFIIMAMAQSVPVMSGGGGLDLSVGPLAGLVNVLIATTLAERAWTDPITTVAVVVGVGVISGLVNGVLVAVVRVQPIIATLATFLGYQGLTLLVQPMAGGTAPSWLQFLTTTHAGIPGIVILIGIIGIFWVALKCTAYHRNLLSIGGDIRAAYAAGVDVTFVKISAYVIAGVLAALVGLALTGVLASGDPTIGTSFTLTSISAVALGGTSLAGGRGGLLGPAVAGATLFLIQNFFTIAHVSVFYLQIFYGVILLVAVTVNSFGNLISRSSQATG